MTDPRHTPQEAALLALFDRQTAMMKRLDHMTARLEAAEKRIAGLTADLSAEIRMRQAAEGRLAGAQAAISRLERRPPQGFGLT